MTQTILTDLPDGQAPVLRSASSYSAAAQGGWLPRPGVDEPECEHACLLVPCDRCGASQFQPCPGGQPCGMRRLLAVDRGHLDPHTGAWLTRGWALGRELGIEVGR
jgi:hypothetical protein